MIYGPLSDRADIRAQIYFRGMELKRMARAELKSKETAHGKRIAA
jgi:hypothetical protein